jgi:hypothetical protein
MNTYIGALQLTLMSLRLIQLLSLQNIWPPQQHNSYISEAMLITKYMSQMTI